MSSYLDHSSHLLTVLPTAGAVFPKSTLNINLLLTSFALRLKTITLIEAHKCLQGPLPPSLPDSLSTMSPPSSSQTHWSCASSPSNMPYSLASQPFSMPFPFLEFSFSPLCLGYSQSSGLTFLENERSPALRCWVQFLCTQTSLSLLVLFSVFNYALLCGVIWSACYVFPLAWKLPASGTHACSPCHYLSDAQHRAWGVEGMAQELGTPRPEGSFIVLVTRTIRQYFSSTKAPTLLLWNDSSSMREHF